MFYKKVITSSVMITYFFTLPFVIRAHNINYDTSILWSKDISEQNSSYNIQKGRLLMTYINSLQKEIVTISNEHYIESSKLQSISNELQLMSRSLNNTLTVHYEKHHAIWVYDSIIEKIKTLKTELSTALKTELELSSVRLEKNKLEKNRKALIVSTKFNNFVTIFTPKVRKLQNTEKRKLILGSITVINLESSKLSLFPTKTFSSQRQMDEYYSNSLRTIKRELQKIQAVILQK